ncbi:MAG: hypothetical protein IIZ46_08250 [Clostridia bacterium]|nr:hypothetical protein [Clostridia bacterium]
MYYLQCKPVIDSILIYRQGDVNGDGKVNAKDALCIFEMYYKSGSFAY